VSLVLVSGETERPELVLQAYHVLLTHHRPDATLVLTVDPGPDGREYARQLGLRGLQVGGDPPADAVRFELVGASPLVTVEALLARL
jgi:hypothetical protein